MFIRKRRTFMAAALLTALSISAKASAEFMIGGDFSSLKKVEESGVKLKDTDGVVKPGLQIFKNHGYTWARVDLYVNPSGADNTFQDLAYVKASIKQFKTYGYKVLLDIMYSDYWCNPGTQRTPAAWTNYSLSQLDTAVYNYSKNLMEDLIASGLKPDMVQIGNETTWGFMWPVGKVDGATRDYSAYAELTRSAINGINDGSGGAPPLKMIHLDSGGDWGHNYELFTALIKTHAIQFDVIGYSYYPFWQGTLAQLKDNLNKTATTFGKPVVVVETAYHQTTVNNQEAGDTKYRPFPETPEGQKALIRAVWKIVKEVPNGLGRGLFYWEPGNTGSAAWNNASWSNVGIDDRALFDPKTQIANAGITAFDTPLAATSMDSMFMTSLMSVPYNSNLLSNPGFEEGNTCPWFGGGKDLVEHDQNSGRYAGSMQNWGGFWQTFDGLKPYTTYVFSAYLKGGATLYVGKWANSENQISNASSSSSYKKVDITFTTGSSSMIELGAFETSGSGTAYADDFSLVQQNGNLINNPGFESGVQTPWRLNGEYGGSGTILASDAKTGTYSAAITKWGCFFQNIKVKPNTTYTLSGQIKASPGGWGKMFVIGYGGDALEAYGTTTTYTAVSKQFTTGANIDTIQVGISEGSGEATKTAYFDDFSLIQN